MKKYFGIVSLFILGVTSYGISSGLVAKSSPPKLAPGSQDQVDAGGASELVWPKIVKSGETVTSSSAAHIQRIIEERHRSSVEVFAADPTILEDRKSVKLRHVLPTNHGVNVIGDAIIFDRQISGPYIWSISVTTANGRGLTEWTYPDGAFMTEAGQQDYFMINEFVPVELQKGTYFLNLTLDCLGEPSNVGKLGPVSSKFEIN